MPADLRLLLRRNLHIEEGALTGESLPAEKQTEPLPADTILADRTNLAFTGTLVTAGQGESVVFATGDKTEMGRIAGMMNLAEDLQTPLTRKIAQFSRLLLDVILALAALIFVTGIVRGTPWPEMFMAAIALAVGAIPEGLPAVGTIALAIGVGRMVRRHAIIRKLPAVETLGSTTVICSDKTGTLTQNQLTMQEIHADGRLYHVTGSGYEAEGKIHFEQAPVVVGENVALIETLGAGLLCNDSRLVRNDEGQTIVQGDPTEAALIVAAQKAGLAEEELSGRLPRLETIPFESEYRCMATLHGAEDEPKIIYIKARWKPCLENARTRSVRMAASRRWTGRSCSATPKKWPRAACESSLSPGEKCRRRTRASSTSTSPTNSLSSASRANSIRRVPMQSRRSPSAAPPASKSR